MGKKYDKLLQLVELCMEQTMQDNMEDSTVSARDYDVVCNTMRQLRRRLNMYDIYPKCPSIELED